MWQWLVIGMSVLCIGAQAQNVTIINHYGDTTGLGPDALFYLKGSEEHTVIVNYFEPATSRRDPTPGTTSQQRHGALSARNDGH